MKTLTVKKLIIPAVIATIAVGCADLQKPQSLLDAEQAYKTAAENPSVQKYATDGLTKANATLLSAVAAESAEDMASLAYIGNAQVETAVSSAAAAQSRQNSTDLLVKKERMITDSISARNDSEQSKLQAMQDSSQMQLQAMQANEAEREILLAFGEIEFVTGTANLVPGALRGIDMLADYMAKFPKKTVSLAGHTDSSGSAELNQNLSQQRANFIRGVLISKGVSAERITAIGYGESQPVASNNTRAGRQDNRRIDIKFN